MSENFKEKLFIFQSAIRETGLNLVGKISSFLTTEEAELIRESFEANEYGLAVDVLQEIILIRKDLQDIVKNDIESIELLMQQVAELYERRI